MVYFSRLVKHGNSLYVSVPPAVRRGLHWRRGDQIAIVVDGERVVASKMDARRSAEVVAELARGKSPQRDPGD